MLVDDCDEWMRLALDVPTSPGPGHRALHRAGPVGPGGRGPRVRADCSARGARSATAALVSVELSRDSHRADRLVPETQSRILLRVAALLTRGVGGMSAYAENQLCRVHPRPGPGDRLRVLRRRGLRAARRRPRGVGRSSPGPPTPDPSCPTASPARPAGRTGRSRPRCSTTVASTPAKACSTCSRRTGPCSTPGARSASSCPGSGPDRDLAAARMTELELEAPVEQLGDTPDERARTRWTGGATCSSADNGVLVPAKDPQALAGAIARRRGCSRPAASSRCSGTSPRSGSSPAPPGRSRRRTPRSSRGPPSSTRASGPTSTTWRCAGRRTVERWQRSVSPCRHLGLLEAPHPGHGSPAALFTDRHAGDDGLAVDVGPVPVGKIEAVDRHATRVPFQFGSAAAAGPH